MSIADQDAGVSSLPPRTNLMTPERLWTASAEHDDFHAEARKHSAAEWCADRGRVASWVTSGRLTKGEGQTLLANLAQRNRDIWGEDAMVGSGYKFD